METLYYFDGKIKQIVTLHENALHDKEVIMYFMNGNIRKKLSQKNKFIKKNKKTKVIGNET